MKIFKGKVISDHILWKPSVVFFGGCLFINWLKIGYMVVLPQWLIEEAAIWGIDLIGD